MTEVPTGTAEVRHEVRPLLERRATVSPQLETFTGRRRPDVRRGESNEGDGKEKAKPP